jgi:hypothetical protein
MKTPTSHRLDDLLAVLFVAFGVLCTVALWHDATVPAVVEHVMAAD